MAHVSLAHADNPKGVMTPELIPFAFLPASGKTVDALIEVQKVLLDVIDDSNRAWLTRGRLEIVLTTRFFEGLLGAHSVSDLVATCREYAIQRLDIWAEGSHRLIEDGKKIIRVNARLCVNGQGHRLRSSAFGRPVDRPLGD